LPVWPSKSFASVVRDSPAMAGQRPPSSGHPGSSVRPSAVGQQGGQARPTVPGPQQGASGSQQGGLRPLSRSPLRRLPLESFNRCRHLLDSQGRRLTSPDTRSNFK
jgi:hypothetical protein